MAKITRPRKVADAPKVEERAEGQPSVAEEIAQLCSKFKEVTLEKKAVEEEQKLRQEELDRLSGRLVELVKMCGLQPPFNLEGGGRISIRHDVSVKQEDKDLLCHSLTALGLQDIIKPAINAQTLTSVVKQRLEEHKELPRGIIVTPYEKAVFTATANG